MRRNEDNVDTEELSEHHPLAELSNTCMEDEGHPHEFLGIESFVITIEGSIVCFTKAAQQQLKVTPFGIFCSATTSIGDSSIVFKHNVQLQAGFKEAVFESS
jgi:hypothetical protein